MFNYFQKFLISLIIFTIPCMNISVKAMDEEENIENQLKTVTKCQNFGAQRIHCRVVNIDGGGLLCDYHDTQRINNLKTKLAKIKEEKAAKDKNSTSS